MVSTSTFRPNHLSTFPDRWQSSFSASIRTELKGLVNNGTLLLVPVANVLAVIRIFGILFVDKLKKDYYVALFKSRLVARNYGDKDVAIGATKAPTVQRFSQRLMFAISTSYPNTAPFLPDISQAYPQSETFIRWDVYIRPTTEMKDNAGSVLNVMKPLYGIPESVLHWYLTYI